MRPVRAIPVALVSLLGLAACGASSDVPPRQAVRQAASSIGDSGSSTFTVSLIGDDDDVVELLSDGEEVTAADRKSMLTLLHSQLQISSDDQGTETIDDDLSSFDVRIGELDHAVEMRTVGTKMFFRVDAMKIAEIFDAPEGWEDGFLDFADESGLDFAEDLLAGKWISTDAKAFEQLAGSAAGLGGLGLPADGASMFGTKETQAIVDVLTAAYEDLEITDAGRDGTGDHYVVSASVRDLYTRLAPAFQKLIPIPMGEDEFPPASEIPAEKLAADVWVNDGKLERLQFDFRQLAKFDDEAPVMPDSPVAIRVDFEPKAADIATPSGATNVDLLEIMGRFMGAAFGEQS